MTSLTNAQKRRLAGVLTSHAVQAAVDFSETYAATIDGEQDTADLLYRAAVESIALWLADLPGDEWDVRLPDPADVREARSRAREA